MRILRGAFNRFLQLLAQFSPGSTTLRPFLHRLRGVKIQGRVFIGDQAYLENEYPWLIELREGAGIALRVTLIAHFHQRHARIILEKDAQVMTGSYIFSSTEDVIIGEGSVVGAASVITKSVPPHVFVVGNPPKVIAECTVPMKIDTPLDEWKKGLVRMEVKK